MPFCDVIIYSYHYLLDPKIAERVSKDLSKDCIVVFDEAHNIDNVCIESLSIDITDDSLRKATRGANNLERKVTEMKTTDAQKLQDEYAKLVEGLREADEARQEDSFMANPALPDDLLTEAVPGNIRRAEHFISFLKRFIEYLKVGFLSFKASILTNERVDENESPHGCCRNPIGIPRQSQREHLHRAEASKVLCRTADFFGSHP